MDEPASTESVFWKSRPWWKRTARAYIGVGLSTVFAFATTLIAARALGPSAWGGVVLALAVASLTVTFLDLTLEEAVVHYGAVSLVNGASNELRGLLKSALVIDAGIGLGVFTALWALASPISQLVSHGTVDVSLVRLAAVAELAASVDGTTGAVLLLAGRPDLRAGAMGWTSFLRFLGVLTAIGLGAGRAGIVVGLAVGAAGGAATLGFIAWRTAWRQWSHDGKAAGAKMWGRRLVAFGIHSSITTSVIAARKALVPLILGRLSGARAVGIFDIAVFPVTAVQAASAPIRFSLLPAQADLWAREGPGELRRSVVAYSKLALVIGVPGAVVGWLLLPWLITHLYPSAFSDAVAPARVLIVAALAYLTMGWAKTLPAAIGRPQVRTAISMLELMIMTGTVLLLGRRGAMGAALALSLTAVVMAVTWWLLLGRVLKQTRQSHRQNDSLDSPGSS